MPDPIFAHPRLAAIYDHFDRPRDDLTHYLDIARELRARSVLDIGCGTGTIACLLAANGLAVTGLEPARASLDVARRKPEADRVRWILGDAGALPPMAVDLAMMTGNVAQVFLTDRSWGEVLGAARHALHPDGHLVFEARDPARKAWLEWTRGRTRGRLEIPGTGPVERWCDLTHTEGELVSFRWTYAFEADGAVISSDSTLRFRHRDAIAHSLEQQGYSILDVRDAPDRPGKEFVFVATPS